MFEVPEYGSAKIFFTAVGVFVVWASWGKGRLSVKYLDARLADFGLSANSRMVVECLVTMVLGVLVAIALVDPKTAGQAIASGMGWTSLIARPTTESSEVRT